MENPKFEPFEFEKLKVYQKSLDLIDHVCSLTIGFPSSEVCGISSQFKRASYSVALNIGEGSAGTRKEFIRFLTISVRSLRECAVCTTICRRQKYIDEFTEVQLRKKITEISKMLSGLINYLESNTAKNILSEPSEDYIRTTNYELSTISSELPTS
jgi:four helix bundle protein